MERILQATKALADESRLRALSILGKRELCVCQIVEFLELAPSTVSKHMAILKNAGLVDSRKEGRWIYYRIPESFESPDVEALLRTVLEGLSDSATARKDSRRMNAILKHSKEDLCKKQTTN